MPIFIRFKGYLGEKRGRPKQGLENKLLVPINK